MMDRNRVNFKMLMIMPEAILEDSLPKYLRGDKTRFTQVLINLVKNSLKFS